MCDLKSKSKLETVTVYKVCYEFEGRYFAIFSGMEVKTGPVEDMEFMGLVDGVRFLNRAAHTSHPLHNPLALGRTSGFKSKRIAARLRFSRQQKSKLRTVILEIELADDIVRGTGEKVMRDEVMNKSIVYAGKTVMSLKEVEYFLNIKEILEVTEGIRTAEQIAFQHHVKWKKRAETRERERRYLEDKMKEVIPV